jgi:hypothetical protein
MSTFTQDEKIRIASEWSAQALSPQRAKEVAATYSLHTNPENLDPAVVEDLLVCALQADMDQLYPKLHAMKELGTKIFDLTWKVHSSRDAGKDSSNIAISTDRVLNICELMWEENVADSLVVFARIAKEEAQLVYQALVSYCELTCQLVSAESEKFWIACYIFGGIIKPHTERQAREMLLDPCLQGREGVIQMIWRRAAETFLGAHCTQVLQKHIGPFTQRSNSDIHADDHHKPSSVIRL